MQAELDHWGMISLNFSGLRPRIFGAVAGGLSVGDSDGQQPGVTKKDLQDGGVNEQTAHRS